MDKFIISSRHPSRFFPAVRGALSRLLAQRSASLRGLTVECVCIDEEHARALDIETDSGVEIILHHCVFTSLGQGTLLKSLRHNRGPTSLPSLE
jgi:hypothetical protein